MNTESKAPLLDVKFDHNAETIPQSIGITDEKAKQIEDFIASRIESGQDDEESQTIEAVLKEFTEPAELVYALVVLEHDALGALAESEMGEKTEKSSFPVFED